jgi:hydrogenase maturation protease
MSDDAVGIRVAEEILRLMPGLEGDLSASGGMDVLDCIIGYDRAVIIDAMVTGKFPAGTVRRVDVDPELETQRAVYTHGMNFLRAIEVGRITGADMPGEILIYGIEVADPETISDSMSPDLAEKVGDIAAEIARDLEGTGE